MLSFSNEVDPFFSAAHIYFSNTCIHGVGCNSTELRGICMFEFPPLLLRERATTGSLSQNLFCQLQAKAKWLIILESLKRKTNMTNNCNHQPNKQDALRSLKGYISMVSLWGSCLKLLRVACTFCFSSLSLPVLVRLLPWSDPRLYLYFYLFYGAYIFTSQRIYV